MKDIIKKYIGINANEELITNCDWFTYQKQEAFRLPTMARLYGVCCWSLSYLAASVFLTYLTLGGKSNLTEDVACFGKHCVAVKKDKN